MRRQTAAAAVALVVLGALLAWGLFVLLPRSYVPAESVESVTPPQTTEEQAVRRIRARMFYLSPRGDQLVGVEQEVPLGEGVLEQAKRIIEAQLQPPAPPLVSAIPEGVKLRALFVASRGEVYVDLSRDLISAHPGGSLNEILTAYTIVNALTVNLPSVTGVQILVEGREVDTLNGHVDLRRPMVRDLRWVQDAAPAATQ
jgi:spore germination protein GerM